MEYRQDISPKKQVRNLLMVIGSGVGLALIVALAALYLYNPTGRYLVKNALLAPSVLSQMAYLESNEGRKGNSLLIFDAIEYSFYDPTLKKMQKRFVKDSAYSAFYQQIAEEKSMESETDEIIAAFAIPYPASLTIYVKSENEASWQGFKKAFQQVQFAMQGDYFRIALHEQDVAQRWIYYYYPGIYQMALQHFAQLK